MSIAADSRDTGHGKIERCELISAFAVALGETGWLEEGDDE